MVKITQVNTRFVVEVNSLKLHILNSKGLYWNLKHVFLLSNAEIEYIDSEIAMCGCVMFEVPNRTERAS